MTDEDSRERTEVELIHWLDPRAHEFKHVVFPGEYRWRDEDKESYQDRVDGGMSWQARKSRFGRTAHTASRNSMGAAIYQAAYSRKQYRLIAWAMWAIDEGYSDREVWEILRHFWRLLPGQTPFVSRTITSWKATRARMRRKGLIWP